MTFSFLFENLVLQMRSQTVRDSHFYGKKCAKMYLIINWSQKRRDTGLASISLLHSRFQCFVIYATQTAAYQTVPSLGVPLSAPGYGLLLKVFASTNGTGTPSGSIYLAFQQMVYSNFFPKYSVTNKELVKHKNSQYQFYSRESLLSIDD